MASRKHSGSDVINLVIVEAAGRNVLIDGANRACKTLNCRNNPHIPRIIPIYSEPSPERVKATLDSLLSSSMVVVSVGPDCGIDTVSKLGTICTIDDIPFAIAEQAVGSAPTNLRAGDLIFFVAHGATAAFMEYDLIADDAVIELVAGNFRKGRAILIGSPATRAKCLIDEVRLEWNDPEHRPVYKPNLTFRLACALTQVEELSRDLDTYEKVANELNKLGWFAYNVEDSRKAVGSLAETWGLSKKNLYLLPKEATRRGFPNPSRADEVFDFIDEHLDDDGSSFLSARGYRYDILHVSIM